MPTVQRHNHSSPHLAAEPDPLHFKSGQTGLVPSFAASTAHGLLLATAVNLIHRAVNCRLPMQMYIPSYSSSDGALSSDSSGCKASLQQHLQVQQRQQSRKETEGNLHLSTRTRPARLWAATCQVPATWTSTHAVQQLYPSCCTCWNTLVSSPELTHLFWEIISTGVVHSFFLAKMYFESKSVLELGV